MKENSKTKIIYFFTFAYFIIFIITVLSKKQKSSNPPRPAAYQKLSKYDCDSVRNGDLDAVKLLRLEMMNQKFKKR